MPQDSLPWERKEPFFKDRKHERSDSIGSVSRWTEPSPHHAPRWGSTDIRRPLGDRKEPFFKERKHERSESMGSVARWRDSSHYHNTRWGSAEFRRLPGSHGKQGGWHLLPDEAGHGYGPSRPGDKILEDESFRPYFSRGEGRYSSRNSSRDSRGSFSQRDWRRGHSWEASNGSPSAPGRPHDGNGDQRSVDNMSTYPSNHPLDLATTGESGVHHSKDQHEKTGDANSLGTGQRRDNGNRENAVGVGPIDWKPLKWTRSGSLSSRGSGFSHSSSSKGMGGVDSNEAKAESQPKIATSMQSPSGDVAACATSAVPTEETTSRKKPRLGWGEGLAKYEKKKVEGPDEIVNKDALVFTSSNVEPSQAVVSNVTDKSPRIVGFSGCASPATPSSVACSSSPGVEEKSFVKTPNTDNDVGNSSGSPGPGSLTNLEDSSFDLDKMDVSVSNLSSALNELLQSDEQTLSDSSYVRSTAMNKLLLLKGDILKALEITESKIDGLDTELKALKSDSGHSCMLIEDGVKPGMLQHSASDAIPQSAPLQTVSYGDSVVDKIPPCNVSLEEIHTDGKDEDVDSPGSATSKLVEPACFEKALSLSTSVKNSNFSENLGAMLSGNVEIRGLVPSSPRTGTCLPALTENVLVKNGIDGTFSNNERKEKDLYKLILTSNKEYADKASEELYKAVPRDLGDSSVSILPHFSCFQTDPLVKERFVIKKQMQRFKERVLAIKFKAIQHMWKEDLRSLSVRNYRAKSQKKTEFSPRSVQGGYQKRRSSIRSRFASPGGTLSLAPTSENIDFTSKLLLDSQPKACKNSLKMPALILDREERDVSRFINNNGLVENPCAVETERGYINPWTSEEKEIFMDKFANLGKDFKKIASFLQHKTVADCIVFYYKNHKSDCFVKIKKQNLGKQVQCTSNNYLKTSGKKWNPEINVASLGILGTVSLNQSKASQCNDGILERSSSYDMLRNERETVAADVLAGMCCSISSEAMSSCVTSSVDPTEGYREWRYRKENTRIKRPLTPDVTQNVDDETCSDDSCGEMDSTDWTDEEKSIFVQAVASYGKDFSMISRCVRTKSRNQCKLFFSKARKCLRLDSLHPSTGIVGTSLSDDADGGGSDMEDACGTEIGSVTCDKSGSKVDKDSSLSPMNQNNVGCASVEIINVDSNLNISGENKNKGIEQLGQKEAMVEALASDASQFEARPELLIHDHCNVVNDADSVLETQQLGKNAVALVDGVVEAPLTEEWKVVAESISLNKVVDPRVLCLNGVNETAVVAETAREGFRDESKMAEVITGNSLNGRTAEVTDVDTVSHVCLRGPVLDSDTVGQSSMGIVQHSDRQSDSHVLDSIEQPEIISIKREDSPATSGSFLPRDPLDIESEKTASQGRSLSMPILQEGNNKQCHDVGRDDCRQVQSEHSLSNYVESSQIAQDYPLHLPSKSDVNGNICGNSCEKFSEAEIISKSEGNLNGRHTSRDHYHKRCDRLKSQSSVTELPLLSQRSEQPNDCYRPPLQGSSDPEKPSRNGDVKLFGKILTHPSSQEKPNVNVQLNDDTVMHHPKPSMPSNLKFASHQNADGGSNLLKFDQNAYVGLDNHPMRSYGYWDGSKIQTGFSSLPDSAVLLAKYPAAFGNYPSSSSKVEQKPSQSLVRSSDHALNGASMFTATGLSASNGVVDFQLCRSRDGSNLQPFTVDMRQRQDILSEMQRFNNGFEVMSALQQQGRGIGVNVVGRGVVGGPCTSVQDPVAAIRMHYAKADQFSGQAGNIMREEESWRGNGDLGR